MTSDPNQADHPEHDDGAHRVEDLPVAPESGPPTGEDQAAANRENDPPA